MAYDIFISYEISDSSLAYELAAVLGRNNVTYYLDCANSCVTMSGYVKGIFEDCRVFVPLVSARYLSEGYARELLSCAVGTNKQVLACFTDDSVLPDEFAAFIPDENRADVRGGDAGAVAWNAISRLLTQDEEKNPAASQEEPSQTTVADDSELESDLEASVVQATSIVVDEEAKQALADLIGVLPASKDEEQERMQCHKPELPETMPLGEEENKDEKEKTLLQRVGDVVFFPFKFVLALLGMALQAPLLTIGVVFFIAIKCCDDDPKVSPPVRQKFTEEQIAEGQRINKLASDYYYGRNGTEKNRSRAVELYVQAAELGNADATYNVGMCAKLGMGCRKDLDVASYYFYLATKMGNERAFGELKELAEAGDANAQNRYGICFEYGYCTKVILKNAAYWYDQAAKQGNPYGQYNLSQCYYRGRGVKRNGQIALEWLKKAADGGHASAQYELGLCYLDGSGVAQNPSEAFYWINKAAAQGNVDALNQLAYCYADGIGTEVSISMALATIDKAIQKDPDEANLYDSKGEFYMMVGDREKAQEMYRKVMEKNPAFYEGYSPTPLYNYINNR